MISDNFAYQYKDNKHLTVVSYVAESLQTHQHEQVISFLLVFFAGDPKQIPIVYVAFSIRTSFAGLELRLVFVCFFIVNGKPTDLLIPATKQ